MRLPRRECSVVITGETGTGKEMVARKIHRCSNRSQNVFVPVDCTSLTGQLFESQLFGHVKGAFTGAISDSLGFFRAADKGTIFLDEIGEVPLDLQAKLLRVLQESCVTPVGSTKSCPIKVRVLCATNRDLREMVRQHTFRQDLYYRLNVVTLQIPPLRDRQDDVLLLQTAPQTGTCSKPSNSSATKGSGHRPTQKEKKNTTKPRPKRKPPKGKERKK